MKKSKFFLASTAVLLSALGANPVLARDVERSITTTIVTPTVGNDKKASTETMESNKEPTNATTAAKAPTVPATPDRAKSVVNPSTPSASDKVDPSKATPPTPSVPDKEKTDPPDTSSKVEQPKIESASPLKSEKQRSGTSETESSKPNQSEPEKKYGDVTVEYKSKDGALIAPKELDTPTSEVGTDYDTTDYRRDTIISSEGKKYRLDPQATQGYEKGKVLEGNTTITYYYDLVTETPDSSSKVVPPRAESTPPDKTKPGESDLSNKGTTPQDKPKTPAAPSTDSSVGPDSSIADTVAPPDKIPHDGMLDTQLESTDTSSDVVNPSVLTEKNTNKSTTSDVDLKKDETFNLNNASSVSGKKGDTIDNPIRSIISPADPLLTDKGFEIIGNDQGEVTIKNADGSKTSVPAAQVGARANPDGTVTVKSSNGKFTLLPDTGEAATILATIGLFILALLGFKKVKPFEKDNWLIG